MFLQGEEAVEGIHDGEGEDAAGNEEIPDEQMAAWVAAAGQGLCTTWTI